MDGSARLDKCQNGWAEVAWIAQLHDTSAKGLRLVACISCASHIPNHVVRLVVPLELSSKGFYSLGGGTIHPDKARMWNV